MGEVPEARRDGAFQACVREIQILQRGTGAYRSRNVASEIYAIYVHVLDGRSSSATEAKSGWQ